MPFFTTGPHFLPRVPAGPSCSTIFTSPAPPQPAPAAAARAKGAVANLAV